VTTLAHDRARALLADAARTVVGLAFVLGLAAAVLAILDAVPAWIAGESRDVRRAQTVHDAERRLHARLVLPAYFPDTLSWPPRRIRFTVGPPGAAALSVDGRDGSPRLLLAETTAPGDIPEALVPEAQVLDRSQVAVGAARGTLSRVVDDGVTGWQLAWEQDGRSLLLRSRGTVDELLRMARSARETP
jgi:hypothetical protein